MQRYTLRDRNKIKRVAASALLVTTIMSSMISVVPANALVSRFTFGQDELVQQIGQMDRQMETAHILAECARSLPLQESESSMVINLAQSQYAVASEKKSLFLNELQTLDDAQLSFDPFVITNLSADAFDYILEGTDLEGMGYAFEDIEQEYGVNGLYALSVANNESGFGASNMAKNKNNYFGMIGCSYDTPYEGVIAFGKLMNKPIYKGKSLEEIAKIYCPPTASHWCELSQVLMRNYWEDLNTVAS